MSFNPPEGTPSDSQNSDLELAILRLQSSSSPEVIEPPPRRSPPQTNLSDELTQGWEFLKFVWRISSRIRSVRNRVRFVIGLVLWKPLLPKEK